MSLTLASTALTNGGSLIQEAGLAIEEFYGTLCLRRSFLHSPGFFAHLYFPETGVPVKLGAAVEWSDG